MTDLNLLRNMLIYGEGYSAEQMALFESVLNEITELRAKVLAFGGFSPTDAADVLTKNGKYSQQLVHFECSGNDYEEKVASMRIHLRHATRNTVLEHEVKLVYKNGGWCPQTFLETLPDCDTPAQSLDKFADWLMRIGLACKVNPGLRTQMEALWKRD